jgi:hypothetical protein
VLDTVGSVRHLTDVKTVERLPVQSGQDVKYGDPFMTTRAALPMTLNETVTAIFGNQRAYRGKPFAHWAKAAPDIAIVIVRGAGSTDTDDAGTNGARSCEQYLW